MAGPWEQYAAPTDGPWTQYQAPAPKPVSRPAAPKPRGILETIGDNFTSPIKQAYQGLQDVNARRRDLHDTISRRSLKDKFLNAPRDMAMGLKNTVDQGLAVGNVVLSPISGAINTVTKPAGDAMGGGLYDLGVNAYRPGGKLGDAPLSREDASQQVTDALATATSLGLPEAGGRVPGLGTKVVDSKGLPKKVYHGTNSDVRNFESAKIGSANDDGYSGRGFYFTSDPSYASAYAQGDNGNVFPAYLNIKKPYINRSNPAIQNSLRDAKSSAEYTDILKRKGYDGVVVPGINGGPDEIVAFHPSQIESAISSNYRPPRALRAAPRTPKVNPDVALLRSRGVDVLPGAAKGGIAKGLEDRAAKLPVVGTKIQQARQGTIESFNKALVNDALSPIGETLPADVSAGHPANAHAYDTIQQAYRANQPARPIVLPRDYADVTQHPDFGILAPESQAALDRIMKNRIVTKAPSGELDGRNFGKAVELLREDIKRTGAQGGEEKIVSGILKDKLDELIGEASVQDPAYAARKESLDTAYAKIKTLQRASQSLGADDGVVTPSQYLNAVKATDSSAGKNRFATGRAFNQEFAQAAKNVLSDKVANTGGEAGIVGNMVMSAPSTIGALVGGPVGAGVGFAGGAGGLYGASKLYEPAAIAKFNAGLDRKIAGGSGAIRLPKKRVNIAPVTPLLAASNLSQEIASLPPLLSKAAAEPPRKRKRKK